MITRDEAERFAARWAAGAVPEAPLGGGPVPERTAAVYEFAAGYVVSLRGPVSDPELLGAARLVVDREHGLLTPWPSVPVPRVAAEYTAWRAANPPAPLTWDPLVRFRRDLERAPAPTVLAELTLADGRTLRARAGRGPGVPDFHPLVAAALERVAPENRERGYLRCAETAALSDVLHAEDHRRVAAGLEPLTAAVATDGLRRGARLVALRVREAGDPRAGHGGPPCLACLEVLLGFGFDLPALRLAIDSSADSETDPTDD